MIISKTPFRISFMGGGSDLKSFYKDEPGIVISTSIDKYIYLSMHKYFHDNKSIIKYSETEIINNINQIKHNLIREVFKKYSINNVDFNSISDIPGGTGMGSSSAFTVGLINLCSNYNKNPIPNYELAKVACEIEIDILKEPIGKQDQYGCAFGGIKCIMFNPDDSVEISPILLDSSKIRKLDNNLLLFYTNINRSASEILSKQNKNTQRSSNHRENLKTMTILAKDLLKEFQKGNTDVLGKYLNESWTIKQKMASGISNPELDYIYKTAIENGAEGGKLLGAGGGGFFLFYCEKNKQEKLRNALSNYKELKFNFEFQGSQIIFNN